MIPPQKPHQGESHLQNNSHGTPHRTHRGLARHTNQTPSITRSFSNRHPLISPRVPQPANLPTPLRPISSKGTMQHPRRTTTVIARSEPLPKRLVVEPAGEDVDFLPVRVGADWGAPVGVRGMGEEDGAVVGVGIVGEDLGCESGGGC